MKAILLLCLLHVGTIVFAQREDNVWMLGGLTQTTDSTFANTHVDFNGNLFWTKRLQHFNPISFTNASICSPDGQLLAYSNGTHIYNRNHAIMQNGNTLQNLDFFADGYRVIQGALFLPWPDSLNTYIFLSANLFQFLGDGGFKPLLYSVIDLNYNNGLGKVTLRKIPFNDSDTLNGGLLTAVRHANGRDWWFVTSKWESSTFVKYLLTSEGIRLMGEQTLPGEHMHSAVANAVFSPDGQWYATYEYFGTNVSAHTGFHLFRFDRCTGEFSQPFFHLLDDVGYPGSAVFSPNSRFLYIVNWYRILQYDLEAPDLLASETVVAEYDGLLDERGFPTRFFNSVLAPDNRIYINIPNVNSRYLHVIDQPNLKGDSCNVIQHAIFLPTYNTFSMPNFPFFRLYAEVGSACDTIVSGQHEAFTPPPDIRVWPVPAAEVLHFSATGEWPGVFQLHLFDAFGQPVLEARDLRLAPMATVRLDALPPGIYFYVLEQNGKQIKAGKVIRAGGE